jgi:hypothetical protein
MRLKRDRFEKKLLAEFISQILIKKARIEKIPAAQLEVVDSCMDKADVKALGGTYLR